MNHIAYCQSNRLGTDLADTSGKGNNSFSQKVHVQTLNKPPVRDILQPFATFSAPLLSREQLPLTRAIFGFLYFTC